MGTFIKVIYGILGLVATVAALLVLFKVINPPEYYLVASAAYVAIGNILLDAAFSKD